jgi:hypothetical protein
MQTWAMNETLEINDSWDKYKPLLFILTLKADLISF